MKTITIGDIHGSNRWKLVNVDEFDRVIFVGDYVDNWPPVTDDDIYNNLVEIINLKKKYPDKVVLLLGNHDMMYYFLDRKNGWHSCSGYRHGYAIRVHNLFVINKDLFQIAYQLDKDNKIFLWTHAGITQQWYVQRMMPFIESSKIEHLTLQDQLQEAFDTYQKFIFDVGYYRGGDHFVGGPVWADATELARDPLPGVHQIVGHTKVGAIKTHMDKDETTSYTFVDRLHSEPDFYELEL